MKRYSAIFILLTAVTIMVGCEFKKNVSRDEIPIIKKSIVAFEDALKTHDTAYLDSLLSSDAAAQGTTSAGIMNFVFSDGLTQFVGFTHKQIFFRGDAARVDCEITGPDGPVQAVTITLRKENDVWLIKKIGPKVSDAIEDDSTGT
jgi:hypothetical protein